MTLATSTSRFLRKTAALRGHCFFKHPSSGFTLDLAPVRTSFGFACPSADIAESTIRQVVDDPRLLLPPSLPPSSQQRTTVVLDLDETLGFWRNKASHPLRPSLVQFLQSLMNNPLVEVLIWTAASQSYALSCLGQICEAYEQKYYQSPQWAGLIHQPQDPTRHRHTKNLHSLAYRHPSDCLLVDDDPRNAATDGSQVVLVPPYRGVNDPKSPDMALDDVRTLISVLSQVRARQNLSVIELIAKHKASNPPSYRGPSAEELSQGVSAQTLIGRPASQLIPPYGTNNRPFAPAV